VLPAPAESNGKQVKNKFALLLACSEQVAAPVAWVVMAGWLFA
jgi:hypothetical protein